VSVNKRDERRQLVLPEELREKAVKVTHDCIMSGHQGIKKTYDRVYAHFYWSGIHADVDRYCKSCDICQRTVPKGRVAKVPLGKMPIINPLKRHFRGLQLILWDR
jgi:Integrase zinc binding domain